MGGAFLLKIQGTYTYHAQLVERLARFAWITTVSTMGKWEIYKSMCSECKLGIYSSLPLVMTSLPEVLMIVSYVLSMWNRKIDNV